MADNGESRPGSTERLPSSHHGAILLHEAARARHVRRLAVIEHTRVLHGRAATLGPSPAGPDRCPPDCRAFVAPQAVYPFGTDPSCWGAAS